MGGRCGPQGVPFDPEEMDASRLLLPHSGFVDYRDERMLRTTDAVQNYLVSIQKWWISVQAKAAAILQPQA